MNATAVQAIRAFEVQGAGIDTLRPIDTPFPDLAPDQVLVRIKAVSLNYRDLITVRGEYGLATPLIPVSDGAGEVVSVGSAVKEYKEGDRVVGLFRPTWQGGEPSKEKLALALGGTLPGLLRQYAVFTEPGILPIPAHLSLEEAATLPCAAVTAWNGLVVHGGLKAGETVLVQGTGGVSIFGLQFAKLFGARVIVTSSSDEKLERARQLGADFTINYRRDPDWEKTALKLTNGEGAHHILDVAGTESFSKALEAAAVGGKIYAVGFLSGKATSISLLPMIRKMLRIQGLSVGHRDSFIEMNRAIALHKVRPVIDKVFPFAEAPAAFRYMETANHFGKIVIKL